MSEEYIDYLTLGLIFLSIFWKLTDPRTFKEKLKSYFEVRSILIGLFSFFFVVLNYLSGVFFPLPYSNFEEVGLVLGILLYAGGMALSVWAKLTMREVWGVPAEHHIRRQDKLIKEGPFKFTRNPIYLGHIMLLLGYGFLLRSYFTFLVLIPIWYFYRSAKKEEKLLEKHFGKKYMEYREKVPRFI